MLAKIRGSLFIGVIVLFLLIIVLFKLYLLFYPQCFYRPQPDGLCQAELDDKPNWVSSRVPKGNMHFIAALGHLDLTDVSKKLSQLKRTVVVRHESDVLIGYRRSFYFGFTDWFCISADGQITSTATLGHSDFGVNRKWVNALRQMLH